MAVRKLKGSWWVDFQVCHQRYRKRSPENTKMGAEAYESTLRQRLARGEDLTVVVAPPKTLTFRSFSSEWFETLVKTENSASEIRTKLSLLKNHLNPFFGSIPLQKISLQLIEQYKALKVKAGLSAKTINNHLIVLQRCLRVAIEWERLDSVPKISRLKTISQRLDFLAPIDSAVLVRSCKEPMWKEMLLVALRTGMRLGELFGLEWQDIDFQRRILTVRRSIVRGVVGTPKSNKIRHIPLADEVCRAIYERRQKSGLVFHRGDGTPLSYRIAENAIRRACKVSGIRFIGWHTLRHTFASQLVSEGIPLNAVQVLLGHSSIVMTMIYAHLAPSALGSAVEVLEKAEKRETGKECQPGVNLEQVFATIND